MRASDKGSMVYSTGNRFFNVDVRNGIEIDAQLNRVELGSEFGITSKEVRNLKKHLGRS